jgi:hypothetical protein
MFPYQTRQSVEALEHICSLANKKEISLMGGKTKHGDQCWRKWLKSSILMPSNPILIPLGSIMDKLET